MVCLAAPCLFARPRLRQNSVMVHQAVFYIVSIVTILSCTAPNFNSAEYVFTNFQNGSGWSNDGISFLIGILGLATGFVALECAAHFSEEMKHATRDVPRASKSMKARHRGSAG